MIFEKKKHFSLKAEPTLCYNKDLAKITKIKLIIQIPLFKQSAFLSLYPTKAV